MKDNFSKKYNQIIFSIGNSSGQTNSLTVPSATDMTFTGLAKQNPHSTEYDETLSTNPLDILTYIE